MTQTQVFLREDAPERFPARSGSALLMPAVNLAAGAALLAGVWFTSAPQPVYAQAASCQAEFASLNKKLEGQIASLNSLTKGKKKQLDPAAACPRLRSLAATERQLLAYMKKEKSWCGIPDDLIQKFTERSNNTARITGQACKAAAMQAQMRRQAEQQAASGPAEQRQRLPAGPL